MVQDGWSAVVSSVDLVAEWSPGVGSAVVEVTEAVFERSARRLGSTLTTMCRTVVPAGRSPRFQVTVPARFEPLLSAETEPVGARLGSGHLATSAIDCPPADNR